MDGTALKRQASKFLSVRLLNPVMVRALDAGLVPRGWALLETTGRRSGEPRRVPVGDGLRGETFWIVAEHGRHADYVRNIEAEPRVRVKVRGRWRTGTAHVLPDEEPWATLQLADLGADVIKLEDPAAGGDVGRYVPPFQEGEDSLFFETFNRNKRSISLDLRHDRGREVLLDLVAAVDVVFSNLRGDQPRRLGLMYEQLAAANPSIVPFQNFRTADGWVVVACAKQKFWVALCGALGRPDLADDRRFADFAARDEHRDELLEILAAAFAERATDA